MIIKIVQNHEDGMATTAYYEGPDLKKKEQEALLKEYHESDALDLDLVILNAGFKPIDPKADISFVIPFSTKPEIYKGDY